MKYLVVLIIISILPIACDDKSSNPTEPTEPKSEFSGNWEVNFEGDMSGDLDFWIANNSEFDNRMNVWTIINNQSTIIYTHIIGNVASNGNLIGIIEQDSTKLNLGTFAGTLSDINGSGTYSWTYGPRTREGEWTAFK